MDSEWDYVQTVNELKDQYDACKSYYENKILKLEYKIKRLTMELHEEKERSAFRYQNCQWSSSRPTAQQGYYASFVPLSFQQCTEHASTYPSYCHCVYCSLDMTRD